MDWIQSNGGPLVCLSRKTQASWGGAEFLTATDVSNTRFRNDYERACDVDVYLDRISLATGEGIILGDEPLMTSVTPRSHSGIRTVRVIYCSAVEDIDPLVFAQRDDSQLEELGVLRLDISDAEWCLFDAAIPGSLADNSCIAFEMPVGDVQIRTFKYNPDDNNSFIIHTFIARFDERSRAAQLLAARPQRAGATGFLTPDTWDTDLPRVDTNRYAYALDDPATAATPMDTGMRTAGDKSPKAGKLRLRTGAVQRLRYRCRRNGWLPFQSYLRRLTLGEDGRNRYQAAGQGQGRPSEAIE